MNTRSQLTPTGLQRRIKRHLIAGKQSFFAICTLGFEVFLKKELMALPEVDIQYIVPGGIEFDGPFESLYYANLMMRTPNRILLRIDTFSARSYPELFDKVSRIPWERYLGFNTTISFDITAKKSRLHHTANIEKAVFDGIAGKMSSFGIAVQSDIQSPIRVFIRMSQDHATVSIDSTGEHLYKRGYREETTGAPLRETTASALLLACEYAGHPVIADPLCGSGTIILEAAQMLRNIASGINRHFAFESWPSFNAPQWNHIKKQAIAVNGQNSEKKLVAQDLHQKALIALKNNAIRASVSEIIIINKQDCLAFNEDGSFGNHGLIISNLPYGKRSGDSSSIHKLYIDFGRHLKQCCKGWHFGFIIPEGNGGKLLGLSCTGVIHFSNGGLPVQFIMGRI
jgi:putative N6-adenine-specific DNA methylase